MTVLHCYTSTHNDLWMVRHYVQHWSQYASKIFVYDDDSTDGTREFLESCAPLVEVHDPGFHGIDELMLQEMRHREYKIHSRGVADWCVIGDSDEFHYHPRLLDVLAEKKAQGYVAVVSQGYQMLSRRLPKNGARLTDAIRYGIYDMRYNRAFFNPEIDFRDGIGHHSFRILDDEHPRAISFNPRGHLNHEVTSPEALAKYPIEQNDGEFKMLHYHYLGYEYVRERHARCWARASERNKESGWGTHCSPDYPGKYGLAWYLNALGRRKRVI